ncbi:MULTISPECIES: substrate-binding domain-containing protein [Pseudomonas]|uniref:substrate-binding domain-containing protein n=1 Tax=Pseudomonas TaxID=286 RepID=UPI000B353905|nr:MULTISPECIES: substrate-binding domain-containing protein [Pseudomonas]PMY65542.1 molybdate ABC transporter substrate-binding protein [Pseudomonas sp. FW126-L8]PMY68219.1 molybdate ABC transporter substrate-binding protein [Pseudomonas sp. FW305-25]PNA82285.1 molybdate ABC transporter substrate-binding protein [Pseudomonas sp. FW305-76]
MTKTLLRLALACLLFLADGIDAQDAISTKTLTLFVSGGFIAAIQSLAPVYEKETGFSLIIKESPPTGNTPMAITNRLLRGEKADIVIMEDWELRNLIDQGQLQKTSRIDLGKSFIAMAVQKGAKKPDIGNMKAFKKTLLSAKSLALSDTPSGTYLSCILFPQMHISESLRIKTRTISAEPVGEAVARGEAEIGFQQLSELMRTEGIDVIGLIPDQVQKMTMYSAAISTGGVQQEEAAALLKFLSSKASRTAIKVSGLIPVR